jgi:hypothetical protein
MEPFYLTMPPPGMEARVIPEPGRPFALTFSPAGMRFERGGRNLYIDAPDGAQIVIIEYFAFEELPAFRTGDGRFVSGNDFLMVMNPDMDLAVAASSPEPAGKLSALFTVPEEPWDAGFYQLAAEDGDARYHAEQAGAPDAPAAPAAASSFSGPEDVRYWLGEDALQGQAFIQNITGSVTVTLITPLGATAEAFIAYVRLQEENLTFKGADTPGKSNGLFQDGAMGRSSIVRRSAPEGDSLILAAEAFSSFQCYYGGWLLLSFPGMRVEGIEILMNAPSGQSVVDLQEYFSHPAFSDVPIAWLYDEERKLAGEPAEFVDDNFDLFDFLDVVTEHEHALPFAGSPEEETLPRRVEDIVLVSTRSNSALKLFDHWTLPEHLEGTDCKTFTFDEMTIPLQAGESSDAEPTTIPRRGGSSEKKG